jgi:hypothetical protein
MFVPKTRTIITLEALVPPFVDAFRANLRDEPEVIDVCFIYGKLCMECGHPGPTQSCWNDNVGNVRGRSARGRYTLLAGAHEYVKIGAIPDGWYEIPNPPGHKLPAGTVAVLPRDTSKQEFRAYFAPGDDHELSLREACDEYVQVLGKHFKRTLRGLAAKGTVPEDLVHVMKADGYFTGDVTGYAGGVGSVARANIKRVEEMLKRSVEPVIYEMISRFDCAATFITPGEGEHTPAHLRPGAKPEEF